MYKPRYQRRKLTETAGRVILWHTLDRLRDMYFDVPSNDGEAIGLAIKTIKQLLGVSVA